MMDRTMRVGFLMVAAACGAGSAPCGVGLTEDAGVCVPVARDDAGHEPLPDAGHDAGTPMPPLEPEPDCARVRAGPSSAADRVLAFSTAHASVRHFGPGSSFTVADNALAEALDVGAFDDAALIAYASTLGGVCVLRAEDAPLPAARVERLGAVAVIHPGAGAVVVPDDAAAIALDLRGLPQAPGLEAALEAALAEAVDQPVVRATRSVRRHEGYTSQAGSASIYANTVEPLARPPYAARASRARPLAVITEPALAPASAELAGTLRLSGRAWLFGAPVAAAAAESQLVAVGALALSYRAANLASGGVRWPDLVPADADAAGLHAALEGLTSAGAPPQVAAGTAARAALASLQMGAPGLSTRLSLGSARAALLTAHGVLKRFYPYLTVVGDGLDDRLREVTSTLGQTTPTRASVVELAGRLGEVIHDGHNFIGDFSGQHDPAGVFPVVIDQVGGEPVVKQSLAPGVERGDTIVEIAGTPAAQWYARELPRTSAASPGYKFDLATRKYLELFGPTDFGLRAPDGGVRTVTVNPAAFDQLEQAHALVEQPSRRLADRGAPDVVYLNLAGQALFAPTKTCLQAITDAQGATGMVIDMRGYPGEEGFDCLSRLTGRTLPSPRWRTPVLTGPQTAELLETPQWYVQPKTPAFLGPAVLLVGPTTVSAAETISTILVDSGRVKKVLGRQSAATNGNITYLLLPGALYFSFTGLEVLHTDGGTYHGRGIIPDLEAAPTVDDLARGDDRALDAAIAALRAP